MTELEKEYAYIWQHFQFNATQRIHAFNFFVIFSVFANGGVFATADRGLHPVWYLLVGAFIITLSIVFWMIDARSKSLLQLSVPGLKIYEQNFPMRSHLFTADAHRNSFLRYTYAFRILFSLQLIFGLGVISYGLVMWEILSCFN